MDATSNPKDPDQDKQPHETTQAPEPTRGGRPSKLTEERAMRFLDAIEAGHFPETAARLAGFSPATLYRWMKADEEPYLTFQHAVEELEARVEAKALGVIMDRIPDDPRLAMEFLKRRFAERWAATREVRVTANEEPPPAPPPSPVNVLVVDHAQVDAVVQQHLDEHRQLTGGSGISPDDLAHHRETGDGEPEAKTDPEVSE